jgi:hypothetical protein
VYLGVRGLPRACGRCGRNVTGFLEALPHLKAFTIADIECFVVDVIYIFKSVVEVYIYGMHAAIVLRAKC